MSTQDRMRIDERRKYLRRMPAARHALAREDGFARRPGRPARVRRRFDAAQAPFDRLAATGILAPKQQAQLQALRAATNPRAVRQQSYALLDQLFALLLSLPGSTQDVCLTLFDSPNLTKGGGDPGNITN
jgi:hypothetical protein